MLYWNANARVQTTMLKITITTTMVQTIFTINFFFFLMPIWNKIIFLKS
jgi:hypothetical protein